jgi:hypothetical protein
MTSAKWSSQRAGEDLSPYMAFFNSQTSSSMTSSPDANTYSFHSAGGFTYTKSSFIEAWRKARETSANCTHCLRR